MRLLRLIILDLTINNRILQQLIVDADLLSKG